MLLWRPDGCSTIVKFDESASDVGIELTENFTLSFVINNCPIVRNESFHGDQLQLRIFRDHPRQAADINKFMKLIEPLLLTIPPVTVLDIVVDQEFAT